MFGKEALRGWLVGHPIARFASTLLFIIDFGRVQGCRESSRCRLRDVILTFVKQVILTEKLLAQSSRTILGCEIRSSLILKSINRGKTVRGIEPVSNPISRVQISRITKFFIEFSVEIVPSCRKYAPPATQCSFLRPNRLRFDYRRRNFVPFEFVT